MVTVGILSPGDMGGAVGQVLREYGARVLTSLAGRSPRTHALAEAAGIVDVGSLEALVADVDILLSVLVPAAALETGDRVAAAVRTTGADLLYADCNAIAPSTAREIGGLVSAAGGRFADAGIIGPPPTRPGNRFYASGPGADELRQLNSFGLDIRPLSGDVGQASGLKMCYAAMTKGLQALSTELLVAARALGLEEALRAEQAESLAAVRAFVERSLPQMPPKAHRWVGEMEEVARTFEDLGLPPRLMEGAADVYRFVAHTPLGQESLEERDPNRGADAVVAGLADQLRARATS
jgi:3-hydroxyisobutyrate dehydrogenase-like beta-hydroxyacid dehydrogenase